MNQREALAALIHEATRGILEHPEPDPLTCGPIADALLARGVRVVDADTLARALARTEVGCWATGARHSSSQDDAVHHSDAVRILAALDGDER